VRDFTAEQVGRAIRFRFTLPTDAVDGEGLTKPLEIEIFRSPETPAANKASQPAAPASFGQSWLSLRPADLAGRDTEGKAEYVAALPPDEFNGSVSDTFHFAVRTLTRGFRGRPIESDSSNVATLTLLDVPQPVTGLAVEVSQAALILRWSVPEQTLTGKSADKISGYRVYRSERDSVSAPRTGYRTIGESHETSYADPNFEFGHFYSYKVRAVVTGSGGSAESPDSAAIDVAPRDVFPPAVPAGVTGLFAAGAVELIWSPNLESDLAGYNIRRRQDGGQPEQLNKELLRSPLYRDTSVTTGHRYFYGVTAVDRSGNESAPSSEVEIEAR
jgi:hypothetical protein